MVSGRAVTDTPGPDGRRRSRSTRGPAARRPILVEGGFMSDLGNIEDFAGNTWADQNDPGAENSRLSIG